jgi:hypothetical protein
MPETNPHDLATVAATALELPAIESAAVFVRDREPSSLTLVSAAGVEGEALDRLVEAVRNPEHPIPQTLASSAATFDMVPRAPGGPALRSHLPIVVHRGDRMAIEGVIAVAHDQPLDAADRSALEQLAERAGSTLAQAEAGSA